MIKLTAKERLYLKDAEDHERLCISKYNHYIQTASSQQLRQVLQWAGQQEVTHLQEIGQMIDGQIPQIGGFQSESPSWQVYGPQGEQSSMEPFQLGSERPSWQIYAPQNEHQFTELDANQSQRPSWQLYGPQSLDSQRGKLSVEHILNQVESSVSPQEDGNHMTQADIASQNGFTGQGQLSDQMICNDLLTTEKEITDFYGHAITESTNLQLRQVLNQIQKEERDHALVVHKYMEHHGWYQA